MSSRSRIIIIVLVALGIAIICFVKLVIYKKADISMEAKTADVEIVSGDLVKSFETDEKAANTKYLNKIILVSGIVDNVSDNKEDITVYLKMKDETSGIMCSFNKNIIVTDALKQGDHVKIKGVCNGYLMDVVLNKCALVK